MCRWGKVTLASRIAGSEAKAVNYYMHNLANSHRSSAGVSRVPWSISLGRFCGVELRLHVILPLWAASELAGGMSLQNLGFEHAAAMTGAFLLAVLVRELGRAATARALGATPGEVILWPLGGLSFNAPLSPTRNVASELGGVLAGAAFLPLLAAGVLLSGAGWESLLFHPFAPGVSAGALRTNLQAIAWWLYYANALVLLANLLIPMASFDLGRILARLFPTQKVGEAGVMCGLALFAAATSLGLSRVVALAMIGVVASWMVLSPPGRRGVVVANLAESRPSPRPFEEALTTEAMQTQETVIEEPELESEAIELPTLDEVLAKISRQGMGSLDSADRLVLARETQARRRVGNRLTRDGDVVTAE